jgi:BASS family bile acid:Na+ symporter
MPVIALLIAGFLSLRAEYAIGLTVIAACPGGPAANVFAYLGKGDVALCVVITVLSSLLAILTLPFFVEFAIQIYMGKDAVISVPVLRTMASLLTIVVVPVALGMAVRRSRPRLAEKWERLVGTAGFVVLVLLVLAILLTAEESAGYLFENAGFPVLLLLSAALLSGVLGGALMGFPRPRVVAVIMQLLIKSGTLGLLVAMTLLDSSAVAVPVALYASLMFVVAFIVIHVLRRQEQVREVI